MAQVRKIEGSLNCGGLEFTDRSGNAVRVEPEGGGIVVAIVRSRASGGDILWITEDMRS